MTIKDKSSDILYHKCHENTVLSDLIEDLNGLKLTTPLTSLPVLSRYQHVLQPKCE